MGVFKQLFRNISIHFTSLQSVCDLRSSWLMTMLDALLPLSFNNVAELDVCGTAEVEEAEVEAQRSSPHAHNQCQRWGHQQQQQKQQQQQPALGFHMFYMSERQPSMLEIMTARM